MSWGRNQHRALRQKRKPEGRPQTPCRSGVLGGPEPGAGGRVSGHCPCSSAGRCSAQPCKGAGFTVSSVSGLSCQKPPDQHPLLSVPPVSPPEGGLSPGGSQCPLVHLPRPLRTVQGQPPACGHQEALFTWLLGLSAASPPHGDPCEATLPPISVSPQHRKGRWQPAGASWVSCWLLPPQWGVLPVLLGP